MLLFLNQFTADLDSFSNGSSNVSLFLDATENVLSPAKLQISEFFNNFSKSLRNILKRIRSKIDLWGNLEIKTCKELRMLSILTV